uniref:Protein indeterminate-domain 12-like n=1 Tax=Rhizophora mucronata TaxID=61149 RepID=A0A2P2M5L5_RHIMU
MVMDTCWLGANIGFLSDFFAVSSLQIPRKVVASPVKLKILISLKPFVADLTNKSIGSQ